MYLLSFQSYILVAANDFSVFTNSTKAMKEGIISPICQSEWAYAKTTQVKGLDEFVYHMTGLLVTTIAN